jgi:hypothetical protein
MDYILYLLQELDESNGGDESASQHYEELSNDEME